MVIIEGFFMKKIVLFLLTILVVTGCTASYDTNSQKPESIKIDNEDTVTILTLFSSKSNSPNKAWIGTFQLVFNDVKNEILKRSIFFENEEPTSDLIGLNNEEFTSSVLNPESYYKSYGKTSPKAKAKIESDLKAKFNEKSNILDSLDWSEEDGKYYAYAMLKKEFEFLKEFDKLSSQSFNNSNEKYDFFGIENSSNEELDKNIRVLSYNSKDDYAVQLLTKSDDIVYLYRTESDESFDKIYKKMITDSNNYQGSKRFNKIDTFKAPNLKFKALRSYDELCNKIIKGTDKYFSSAIETIELELNNKGGKIKSEAIVMIEKSSIAFDKPIPRNFDFDKTFVLFLVDKNKTEPYFALRVKDLENLNN